MRLIFAGTPAVAVPSLEALAAQHDVARVVTRPDAPVGRRKVLTPSPVAACAERLDIPTLKTPRLDDAATEELVATGPDLGVIVAYGGLVREPLLSAPRLGWINVHFSLLPRWRGAAPVQWAIMSGDAETGVAVMQLAPELDAGDVFARVARPIGDETAGELLAELAIMGSHMVVDVVNDLVSGVARAEAQEGEVTLAPKLTRAHGEIDWSRSEHEVLRQIRGVTPEPGAHTTCAGVSVKVVSVESTTSPGDGGGGCEQLAPGELAFVDKQVLVGTGGEAVRLVTVQPAGKREMSAADWWRGLSTGAVLGA